MLLYFVENANDNDPNLFEGDIRLTPEQRKKAMSGQDVDSDRKRGSSKFPKWPRGVVVYTIHPTLGEQN